MKLKSFLLSIYLLVSALSSSPIISASLPQTSVAYSKEDSPTQRYLTEHRYETIKKELAKFGFSSKDEKLFKKMIEQENSSFIGYHASSTDFLIFQDIIRMTIEDIMKISIPKHFHFFRNPLDNNLIYETANEFTEAMPIPKSGKDSTPAIRMHILSLNIALYQSYGVNGNSTPIYYLDNETWTVPPYIEILESFFEEIGLNPKSASSIYTKARKLLPTDRGTIYQFFIKDNDYPSINNYFYVSKSGGEQISEYTPTDVLFDYNRYSFPQMRMVLNSKSTLNPYHKLEIQQFNNLSKSQRNKYESCIRDELRKLSVESKKLLKAKNKLIRAWDQ